MTKSDESGFLTLFPAAAINVMADCTVFSGSPGWVVVRKNGDLENVGQFSRFLTLQSTFDGQMAIFSGKTEISVIFSDFQQFFRSHC